jgi:uncharacterized membrane protein
VNEKRRSHFLERLWWATLQVVERKIHGFVSAPLLAMVIGCLLSLPKLLPASSATYDLIWSYGLPFGAALFLLESDLRR